MSSLTSNHRPTKIELIALALGTIILLAPFMNRAVHIDDPLYIWTAQHIHVNPWKCYDFDVNWYGTWEPMPRVINNPPFVPYYFAFVSLFTGWNVNALHIAMFIPAIGVVMGLRVLAAQLGVRAWPAVAACVLTPGFLVSSTTLMVDITMLCFWMWAIVFWISGIEQNRLALLLVASLCIALSSMCKYFGASLIPLLGVHALIKTRRIGLWAIFLLIPVAVLALFQWVTYEQYGEGMLSIALKYPGEYLSNISDAQARMKNVITGFSFIGGTAASMLFLSPLLFSKRSHVIAALISVILITLLVYNVKLEFGPYVSQGNRNGFLTQFSLWITVGIGVMALAVADLWRNRNAVALLLFMWILGTFVFVTLVNWSVTTRTVLPMIPAVGLLVARQIDHCQQQMSTTRHWATVICLIPAGVLALVVAWADCQHANSARTAAQQILEKHQPAVGTLWFQGHWGFQYYMQQGGAQPLDFFDPKIQPGDIVVIPSNNSGTAAVNEDIFQQRDQIELRPTTWISTMSLPNGSGFHSSAWGTIPFAFSVTPPERYTVYAFVTPDLN